MLVREARLYTHLRHVDGIPKIQWCGTLDDMFYIVMPIYMGSIQTYRVNTLDQLYDIGNSLLNVLNHLHQTQIIHRDIKPDNIMYDANGKLFIIDLGLCAVYPNPPDQLDTRSSIIGTPNYISMNVHQYKEPFMKDDVESIMYVLIYKWNNNEVPWKHISDLTEISALKASIRTSVEKYPKRILDYLIHNDAVPDLKAPMYIL